MQNQCFRRISPSLLLSFFPTFEIAFFEKRELGTQFSFLCMSTTVSGSNSWIFAIIGDQPVFESLAARLANNWRYRRSQIFRALLPFFFLFLFFACFLIFLKKGIFRKKDSAGDIPKEKRRNHPNHGSSNDERDF